MTTDLLFSILPRLGTVPIEHDEQKVQKLNKETALRQVNEDDRPFNRRKGGGNKDSSKYKGPYDRRSSRTRRDPSARNKQQKQRADETKLQPQPIEEQPGEIQKFKPLDIYV